MIKSYKTIMMVSFLQLCVQGYNDSDKFQITQVKEVIRMQTLDKYLLLVLAPVAFLCTFCIALTFFCFPRTRKMPGDIIFAISLCECILTAHWFLSALWEVNYDVSNEQTPYICKLNAFFSIMAGTGEFIYNLAFCAYLRVTLTQVLKVNKKIRLSLHVFSLCIIIGLPIASELKGLSGIDLYGSCAFSVNKNFPFVGLILVVLYMFFSIYTVCFFKHVVPDNQQLLTNKRNFIKYYINYVIASCVIWTILAFSNLMVGLNFIYFKDKKLDFFVTIGSLSKLATPIVLSILRYQDPTIKTKIGQLFAKILHPRRSLVSNSNEENWIGQIAQNIKYLQVKTILTGIRDTYRDIIIMNQEIELHTKSVDYELSRNRSQLFISDQNPIQYLRDQLNISQNQCEENITVQLYGSEILAMRMTVYAPQVFRILSQWHRIMVNPIESLDLMQNEKQLSNFKNPDGGKSGEFFFFTNDNKLILKTISDDELIAFQRRIPNYLAHVTSGDTMISVIYGLFTFERQDTNGHPKINVCLMRNISQCSNRYKIRTFDLKGSEFDRQVIPKKEMKDLDLSQTVLKDTDFFRTENTLKVSLDLGQRIKEALIRDVNFFKQMKLMDYSLLVIKVNWKLYVEEQPTSSLKQIMEQFADELMIIPSIQEEGTFYHLSIIDYFQEWTTQKVMEQKTKKIIHANVFLDTSAQNPELYGERFKDKLVKQII